MKHCSPRQEAAFHSLQTLDIFTQLEAYTPVLTGTIPLDIDIENSDLDIICWTADLEAFARDVTAYFGNQQGFQIAQKTIRSESCIVAKFEFQGFPIEIFAQNRPVEQQYAYRHMLIEARLLVLGGASARQEIRRLKQNGLKTEPAFARYFNLAGDPYEVLYRMSFLREDELRLRW